MAKESVKVTWEAAVAEFEGRPLQVTSTVFPTVVLAQFSHGFNPNPTNKSFYIMEMMVMSVLRLN